MKECCDYAYKMDEPFDLTGIRQFIKMCHVYKTLESIKSPKILDIGSGYCEIESFLKQNRYNCEYFALDVMKREEVKVNNFTQFDITSKQPLPYANSAFDAILMLDFLQNIDKKYDKYIFSEIRRVAKENAKVCISVRNIMLEPETNKNGHLLGRDILELMNELTDSAIEVNSVYGVNYRQNEEEALSDNIDVIGDFLPSRLFRTLAGLEMWWCCKFVMMDCEVV